MGHEGAKNSIQLKGAPRLFDRIARKFNVDYAFNKAGPKDYLLFFKSGQADVITAAFLPSVFPVSVHIGAALYQTKNFYAVLSGFDKEAKTIDPKADKAAHRLISHSAQTKKGRTHHRTADHSLRAFPTSLVARALGFGKREYLEAQEGKADTPGMN